MNNQHSGHYRCPKKAQDEKALKKYITDCEISGSDGFHTPSSAKLHAVSGFLLIFFNFHFIVLINLVLRKQWCVMLTSLKELQYSLIEMRTNFRNSQGKKQGIEEGKKPQPPGIVKTSELLLPVSQVECSGHGPICYHGDIYYLSTPDLLILGQKLYANPKQFYLRKWGNAEDTLICGMAL